MSAVPFEAQQQFGQYTLIRPIAVGGMAEVWLAKLDGVQGFQKKVALKRMTGTIAEQPAFVTMFLDEARLMSGLTHPNICQVYELGQREDNFYVAMEFIDGQTVQHLMRAVTRAQTHLPLELALKIARDTADALHYAHTKVGEDGKPLMVIHRDVSPQNLMVTYEGVPKLLDFGIAKAATRTNSTEVGQLKGKLSYMPPEQARGETLDARADQFSLGVTLFEMLTHTRLYPPLQEMDLFRLVAFGTEPYETARQREPGVPEVLSELLAKMMSRNPKDRFASMAEVRDRLTSYLHDLSQTIPSSEALALFMQTTFPPEAREQELSRLSSSSLPRVGTGVGARRKLMLPLGLGGVVLTSMLALGFALRPIEVVPPAPVTLPPVVAVPEPVPVFDAGPPVVAVEQPEIVPIEPVDAGLVARLKKVVPRGKDLREGKGTLSLQTSPWSIVMFGKKNLGETPLVGIPFPVGKHRLVLVNDERKLKTTIEVEIKPNQVTTLKLKL